MLIHAIAACRHRCLLLLLLLLLFFASFAYAEIRVIRFSPYRHYDAAAAFAAYIITPLLSDIIIAIHAFHLRFRLIAIAIISPFS